jgi:hypothetical protein
MKTHYCKAEKTTISFEGECNWCGAKEKKQLEMIERVKELVKQCEFENYDWNGTLIESGFNTEKFAELIVQEFKKEPVNNVMYNQTPVQYTNGLKDGTN